MLRDGSEFARREEDARAEHVAHHYGRDRSQSEMALEWYGDGHNERSAATSAATLSAAIRSVAARPVRSDVPTI